MSGQEVYNVTTAAARALEDFVDELVHQGIESELRTKATTLRHELRAFAVTHTPPHLRGPVVSETDLRAMVTGESTSSPTAAQRRMSEAIAKLVTPPVPPELCGIESCIYLPHTEGKHSWEGQ